MIDFQTVLFSVLSLVLLAVPGFIMAKTKLISEKGTVALSNLVLYGLQTFLVFMSFQSDITYSSELIKNMLYVCGLAILIHLIMTGLVFLLVRGKKGKDKNYVRYAGIFSNCGFMGLPFLKMLFESSPYCGEVMIYCAVVIAIFNIFNWTVGVLVMSGDRREVSIKKIVLNPVIIAVLLGMVLFFIFKGPVTNCVDSETFGGKLLASLYKAFNMLGNAVTPVSMVVIGAKLASVNSLKKVFLNGWAYYGSFIKLVVMSFITIFVVAFLPISSGIKYALFFLLSMPCATSTTLFAVRFNGDSEASSVTVLLSTILSIITIPLMFLVINGLFQIPIA